MALKKILTEPNKTLRQKSLQVERVDGELQSLDVPKLTCKTVASMVQQVLSDKEYDKFKSA